MRKEENKFIIEYSENGEVMSDFKLEEYILNKYKNNENIKTSSGIVIDYSRLLIKNKILDYKKVLYKYKDVLIRVDKYANLESWPIGFNDIYENILLGMMDWNKEENQT